MLLEHYDEYVRGKLHSVTLTHSLRYNRLLLLINVCKIPVSLLFIRLAAPNYLPIFLVQTHAESWFLEEHGINLLQRPSRCLHTKEVCKWHERRANHSPDPEVVALDVVETDGCDHYDDKVGHPVRKDAHGRGFVTNAKGLDLGRVGPRYGQDTESEAVQVQEHECHCGCCAREAILGQATRDYGHADCTTSRRSHDRPAPPDLVYVKVWRPRENSVLRERYGC